MSVQTLILGVSDAFWADAEDRLTFGKIRGINYLADALVALAFAKFEASVGRMRHDIAANRLRRISLKHRT